MLRRSGAPRQVRPNKNVGLTEPRTVRACVLVQVRTVKPGKSGCCVVVLPLEQVQGLVEASNVRCCLSVRPTNRSQTKHSLTALDLTLRR